MSKELKAWETIKYIGLTHMGYDQNENLDGEWEYEAIEVDDGTIEENYPEEIKIIETALKSNKRKLDLIGEILVDISKGNYADLDTAIDEIREVLGNE